MIEAIREALPQMDKKIAGFAMHDAVLTGVETRTSSPIRVRRRDDYQSMNVEGLYPAGEGAGYAGGIYSAAIDGIEVAEALALNMARARRRREANAGSAASGRAARRCRAIGHNARFALNSTKTNDPSHPGCRLWRGAAGAVCRFPAPLSPPTPRPLGHRVGDGAATHPAAGNLPPLYRAPEIAGRTVRQIVYPTLSGKSARVHLSNEYGKTPLVIEELRVARSGGGAARLGNGEARVTFGGKSSVSIPPGAELDSDPIAIDVAEARRTRSALIWGRSNDRGMAPGVESGQLCFGAG